MCVCARVCWVCVCVLHTHFLSALLWHLDHLPWPSTSNKCTAYRKFQRARARTHTCTRTHTYTHMRTHMCTHAYAYTHTRAHVHTHIQTHTHTCCRCWMPSLPWATTAGTCMTTSVTPSRTPTTTWHLCVHPQTRCVCVCVCVCAFVFVFVCCVGGVGQGLYSEWVVGFGCQGLFCFCVCK